MSFDSVWGFDPDSMIKVPDVFCGEPETDQFSYNADEQSAARIPLNELAQVYELRRMYRL